MLAEVIADDEIEPPVAMPVLVVAASTEPRPEPDRLRHARVQMQRSILTYSLFARTLSCGSDLLSYEKVMRDFFWTPNPGGR